MLQGRAGSYLLIVLLAMLITFDHSASAQEKKSVSKRKLLTQYLQDQWTMREGLPNNSVLDIQQDSQGYLWLATFNGIVRFDGIRFTVFNQGTTEGMTASGVLCLNLDQDGNLLAGTNGGGLLRQSGERFKVVPGTERQTITSIFFTEGGELWLGTRNGLLVWHKDRFISPDNDRMPPDLVGANVYALGQTNQGVLLAGCANVGLFERSEKGWQPWTGSNNLPSRSVRALLNARNGTLYVGTDRGLLEVAGDSISVCDVNSGLPHSYVNDLMEDNEGQIWVATDRGVVRLGPDGLPEPSPTGEPFLSHTSQKLLQDREGNFWIGTYRQGITRLKDGKFINYTADEGLPAATVNTTYAEADRVWVGTNEGLVEISPETNSPVTHTLPGGPAVNRIRSIGRDHAGRLLLVTNGGLVHFENGNVLQHFDNTTGLPTNRLRDMAVDSAGHIWLGTSDGWGRWNGKGLVLPASDSFINPFVLFVNAGKDGRIMAGTNGRGLQVVSGDSLITIDEALPSKVVFEAYEDEEGLWWIGTNSGLALMNGWDIYSFDIARDIGSGSIFDILPDKQGNLWIMTDRGVLRTNRKELLEIASGRKKNIENFRLFGRAEGLAAYETTGAGHGCVDPQGRLWVPTPEGVTMIDPENLDFRQYVPPVIIEKVLADGQEYSGDTVSTMPGVQRFEIQYTGLGLYAPRQLTFMYKLEGFDNEWVNAGNRRTAYYTNLSPGAYEFKVKVINQDGFESEAATSLALIHNAHFFQKRWFYWLIGAILLTLLAAGVMLQTRSYKVRNLKLEKTVMERTQTLQKQHSEISRQSTELKTYYDTMQQSISYAARLQKAVMPDRELPDVLVADHFILFRPKEKVSGDFYWYAPYGEGLLVAAVDCTGHGVPGALMATLAYTLLSELAVKESSKSPGELLTELDRRLRTILHSRKGGSEDGMDIAMLEITQDRLRFAGAKRPLLLIRNNDLEVHKGDRPSIGSVLDPNLPEFTTHTISPEGVSWAYMFSDGYTDQFREGGKKFMVGRFRETLGGLHMMSGEEQRDRLEATLLEWMGDEEQVDDILVFGLKLNRDISKAT
ncbi:two-component regulator propeller domain-containing protein [Roseivirga sp. BDSF3-8]|uniref:two-component regulator propeller domain-containing protein n=1 Tax=Roseivirga sp. BDSF3-8 TaxID=3241598 RepID=UPI00353214B7